MEEDKQAATVDYYNNREVVQHFRDLLNLSPLLENGLDVEVEDFRNILAANNWAPRTIQKAYEEAGQHTNWERELPPPIPDGNTK